MSEARELPAHVDESLVGIVPPDVGAMIDRMVDDLRASGSTPGIEVGEAAPLFQAPNAVGEIVGLADRLAAGPVVLTFYRGAWCPFCSVELRSLQEVHPEIAALGASLIAVNPQSPDDSLTLSEKLELGFDVLSDVDQTIAERYRVRFTLTDELQRLYEQFGIPLTTMNADGTWDLPVPATFVIDTHGIVRARHVDPNYRRRAAPAAIVAALHELSAT